MARKEQINIAAKNKYPYIKGLPQSSSHQAIFIEGAEWADENPKEGLVDINKAREWVKNVFIGPFGEGLANSIADEFVKEMEG